MTPEQFIAKWQANTRSEAAASKEHFLDLCALLGVDTPNSDPTGAGWADVWPRQCTVMGMNDVHRQSHPYAGMTRALPASVIPLSCDQRDSASVDFLSQEVADAVIDLVTIRLGQAEHREMRLQAVDDAKLAVRDEFLLGLAIGGREEHVA